MSDEIDQLRRRLFGTAAMTLAASQFAFSGTAEAQPATKSAASRQTRRLRHSSRSTPDFSTSDTRRLALPTGPPSSFSRAGRTTSTASPMSRLCLSQPAIG